MMHTLLAQMGTTDPVHVRDFLIIGGFLLSAIAGLGSFLASRKVQKREVAISDEFVTKPFCHAFHAANEQRIVRLETDIIHLRQELKNDREQVMANLLKEIGSVHNRVNEVLEAVSELRGEMNQMRHGPR